MGRVLLVHRPLWGGLVNLRHQANRLADDEAALLATTLGVGNGDDL